ncbi:hypothetical protein VTL71DRAFT_4407 [Oculimacula yallundae]|uniref:non-specific serine/threonine protein kinase n=1 Tax=Oculimacula yallundae TaxID=86028 RepID=A0ABR4C1U0_9HELO
MSTQDRATMEVEAMQAEGSAWREDGVSRMRGCEIQYMPPQICGVEEIELYRKGGYHPVLLRDEIRDGQYQIIHKLGHGGFATVWLARDTIEERYVAIKIIMADASENAMDIDIKITKHLRERASPYSGSRYIDIPIEHFWITGPNGNHLCIVSEVAGPSIARLSQARLLNEDITTSGLQNAQIISLQIAQSLEFLHSPEVGIAHGDLTSSNVLLELENLDVMSPEELIKLFGKPVREQMQAYAQYEMDASAPKFIYEAADAMRLLPYCTGNIKIIDFGASYFLNNPPAGLATPVNSCAPEYLRGGKFGKECDVWAFANTLFEIRSGYPLITQLMGGGEEALIQIQTMLGSLPPRANNGKTRRGARFDQPLLKTWISDIRNSTTKRYEKKQSKTSLFKSSMSNIRKGARKCRKWLTQANLSTEAKAPPKIAPEEAEQFHDLLCKLFDYDVEKRLTMAEVWKHTWFTMIL